MIKNVRVGVKPTQISSSAKKPFCILVWNNSNSIVYVTSDPTQKTSDGIPIYKKAPYACQTKEHLYLIADSDGLDCRVQTEEDGTFYFSSFLGYLQREDLTSLSGLVSPNNAGILVVSSLTGTKIKVYDAGYHGAVDGLHYFYFGTSTSPTTKRLCTINLKGLIHKTFVQPRISDAGDGLYLFSSVAETNIPYDVGYVQEP